MTQVGFGDFCRSCARDTCASVHIGRNKSHPSYGAGAPVKVIIANGGTKFVD